MGEKKKKMQIIIGNTAKQYLLLYEAVSSVQMISCHSLLGSDVTASEGEGVRLGATVEVVVVLVWVWGESRGYQLATC